MRSTIEKRLAALEAKRNTQVKALWDRILNREKEIIPSGDYATLLIALRDNQPYPDAHWRQLCDDPIAGPVITQISRYNLWSDLVFVDALRDTT